MTTRRPLSKERIAELNEFAVSILPECDDNPVVALHHAVSHFGLDEINEDGYVTLYETPDGFFVNCWYEGIQSSTIADGGFGFDDILELHD